MTEFIYQTIIIQTRIPIKTDGTLGKPEIMKKFVTDPTNATKKKKSVKTLLSGEIEEIEI